MQLDQLLFLAKFHKYWFHTLSKPYLLIDKIIIEFLNLILILTKLI